MTLDHATSFSLQFVMAADAHCTPFLWLKRNGEKKDGLNKTFFRAADFLLVQNISYSKEHPAPHTYLLASSIWGQQTKFILLQTPGYQIFNISGM